MITMTRYKIRVNLVSGNQLTFTVNYYVTLDDGWIEFTDEISKSIKRFDGRNCQIEVLEND